MFSARGIRLFATMATPGRVQQAIEAKLKEKLSPLFLEVVNESYKHAVPKGSETHFKVMVVSDQFTGKSILEQHKMVNEILKDELSTGVHALSIKTVTPKKWTDMGNQVVHETPNCMGGSKK